MYTFLGHLTLGSIVTSEHSKTAAYVRLSCQKKFATLFFRSSLYSGHPFIYFLPNTTTLLLRPHSLQRFHKILRLFINGCCVMPQAVIASLPIISTTGWKLNSNKPPPLADSGITEAHLLSIVVIFRILLNTHLGTNCPLSVRSMRKVFSLFLRTDSSLLTSRRISTVDAMPSFFSQEAVLNFKQGRIRMLSSRIHR